MKRCSICKQKYPATREYFHKHKGRKDGLNSTCKSCACKKTLEWGKANPEKKRESAKRDYHAKKEHYTLKRRQWNKDHPGRRKATQARYRESHRDELRRKGLEYYYANKDVMNCRQRERYAENIEEERQKAAAWRDNNREAIRQYHREWSFNHKATILARSSEYRKNNPEKRRVTCHGWYERNREKAKVIVHKRLARKRNFPDTLTVKQWGMCLIWWEQSCAYCGQEASVCGTLEMEHVVPLTSNDCPGTTALNIIPACRHCNSSKNNRPCSVWLCNKMGLEAALNILYRIVTYFEWVNLQYGV